jgi:NAD(P)-dependent dehydrogenase (short-subunit alcohol dehydrogenase family)
MNLQDRVVLVTGAVGNLGRAVAREVVAAGGRVCALDRDESALAAAYADELAAGRAAVRAADVLDPTSMDAALGATTAAFGGSLDGVVATVGAWKGGAPFVSGGWGDWEAMLSLNLRSAVVTLRAAIDRMPRGGSLVTIASLAGTRAAPGESAYGAAKAAVVHLTETLAVELKDRGIRANAILPGTLDTPQNRAWMDEAARSTAMGLDDVARVARFLLSDASGPVTGSLLRATGKQ